MIYKIMADLIIVWNTETNLLLHLLKEATSEFWGLRMDWYLLQLADLSLLKTRLGIKDSDLAQET